MKERACACFLILGSIPAIQASQMCQGSPLGATSCGFLYSGGVYQNFTIGFDRSLTGINNAGEIAGWYVDSPGGIFHSFLYRNGTFTTIDLPGPQDTIAGGINDSGEILVRDLSGHQYIYHSGVFTPVDTPGPAMDINDSGQIVGYYSDAHGTHGYLDSSGTITTIDFPGSASTYLNGINNAGQIVGGDDSGAFLFESGHLTRIQVPGALSSLSTYALGINDSGQIVGSAQYPARNRGFLDDAGVFTTIGNLPSSTYCIAASINDAGQIVGECLNAPAIPEPASLALFGSGLAVFVALLWRRNKVPRSCLRPAL